MLLLSVLFGRLLMSDRLKSIAGRFELHSSELAAGPESAQCALLLLLELCREMPTSEGS